MSETPPQIDPEFLAKVAQRENFLSALEKKFLTIFSSTLIAVVATASIGLALGMFLRDKDPTKINTDGLEISYVRKTELMMQQFAQQLQEVRKSLAEIEKKISATTTETKLGIEIAEARRLISGLQEKYKTIEKAIVQNPERAMSIPMMRKDIVTLQTNIEGGLIATRKEIDRIYDFNKWFIALIVTMALGVLGLVWGNFFRKDPK